MNVANEVEIVVTAKTGPLRQYAERIESRIRDQGLAVDVLFPHEEIPIRQVLADLSSRGTLYGIVLSPINPEHGSITLNILFGQPEGKSSSNVNHFLKLLFSFRFLEKTVKTNHFISKQLGGEFFLVYISTL
jgi:hypothetical protein